MPIFKRRKSAAVEADPIGAFWTWWTETGAAELADAVTDGWPAGLTATFGDRISRIHPELDWEFGPGLHAQHALIVTAAGNPARRAVARRWLRTAPESDQVWEYADLRRPRPTKTIRFEGLPEVPIEKSVVVAEPDASSIHVGVYHPAFPELPPAARQRVTFLILDLALGEELVETWIGAIETLESEPPEAEPISTLLPAVAEFAAAHTLEDGSPAWKMLEGTRGGERLIATAEYPLRSIRRPHLDTHVEIAVGYPVVRDDGLPEAEMLDELRAFEDHLTDRLGGSGNLLAHETSAGTRLLHYYIDGATPAAAQLRAATPGWTHGKVAVTVSPDPAWENVAHLSG
ncbi:DUF695 domain-containing protein [Kribbella sandramycini]|uniref:DUF695 domain-containing protein n=1 Tax=Kribbella sandramycini TaxID=60450 RepID=A0A7Y4L1G6_9ACTN|nr:DUF695 domain-containing protein [Kribbella sandramycini]MBB6564902.1 hypothetical protein [Kribbella sandramycini]NOL42598.1 DUF695 domain-containing protein [Kribbella sandramycini]